METLNKLITTYGPGVVRKVLMLQGLWFVQHGIFSSSYVEVYVSVGTALVGAAWSFWNDSGKALFEAQYQIILAKTLAQAQALRMAGQSQVTVKEIAQQSPTMTLAETAKIIPTLPAEVQANIAPAPTVSPVAKVAGAVILALMIGSLWPDPASAQVKIKTPAQIKQDIDNFNAKTTVAVTGQSSQQTVLKDVMSALAKPFQDLADFIAKDADGAATLATQIPNLQDVNGKACWIKMQQAGAVFKAHPVPATFNLMTDFEALRLLQMTTNDLCSYTPCTVVFSDASNLVTGVASAVGGAVASALQIPSLTTLCSRIPQIAPQLPAVVTGLGAAASPAPVLAPATTQGNPALGAGPSNPAAAIQDTAPAVTPAPATKP